jgi:hypothetical protein
VASYFTYLKRKQWSLVKEKTESLSKAAAACLKPSNGGSGKDYRLPHKDWYNLAAASCVSLVRREMDSLGLRDSMSEPNRTPEKTNTVPSSI